MSAPDRLCVAFLWHQHQPFYRAALDGPPEGAYLLPWVRLHAVRDYYPMAMLLDEFPGVRATVNLVPSMVAQLEDYTERGATDLWMELSLTPSRGLGEAERGFVVARFFDADRRNEIAPFPRYAELFEKRRAGARMTDADITDLRMWFNLAWFPPEAREGTMRLEDGGDLSVSEFVAKGRGFDDDEIAAVLDAQLRLMRNVVPLHRRLAAEGRIEVSVSPFYHPILPLVADSSLANVDAAGSRLPQRFAWPEDARAQLEHAAAFHAEHFGARPRGLWPSEGSVGEHVVPLVAGAGFSWMATDAGVLARSGRWGYRTDDPEVLLRPYLAGRPGSEVSVFFRHTQLSNDIGFTMQRYDDYDRAAADYVCWMKEGFARRVKAPGDRVLSIVLDGENAWGSYRRHGREFLRGVYRRLSDDPELVAVTFSEFLDGNAARGVRPHPASSHERVAPLYCASWIDEMGSAHGNDLNIWIGGPEENRAWDLLGDARRRLAASGATPGSHPKAYEALYAAEGSDWFWWFGDDFSLPAGGDWMFDWLFRERLKDVYRGIGAEPPPVLDRPIVRRTPVWTAESPVGSVRPGRKLRVIWSVPGCLRWTTDAWRSCEERELDPVGDVMALPIGYAATIGPFGREIGSVQFAFRAAGSAEIGERHTVLVTDGGETPGTAGASGE
jgi:alpha-amylase/alpha-mannosidase (GH57 family)